MIDDFVWDLFAFVGHSPVLGAKVPLSWIHCSDLQALKS